MEIPKRVEVGNSKDITGVFHNKFVDGIAESIFHDNYERKRKDLYSAYKSPINKLILGMISEEIHKKMDSLTKGRRIFRKKC